MLVLYACSSSADVTKIVLSASELKFCVSDLLGKLDVFFFLAVQILTKILILHVSLILLVDLAVFLDVAIFLSIELSGQVVAFTLYTIKISANLVETTE